MVRCHHRRRRTHLLALERCATRVRFPCRSYFLSRVVVLLLLVVEGWNVGGDGGSIEPAGGLGRPLRGGSTTTTSRDEEEGKARPGRDTRGNSGRRDQDPQTARGRDGTIRPPIAGGARDRRGRGREGGRAFAQPSREGARRVAPRGDGGGGMSIRGGTTTVRGGDTEVGGRGKTRRGGYGGVRGDGGGGDGEGSAKESQAHVRGGGGGVRVVIVVVIVVAAVRRGGAEGGGRWMVRRSHQGLSRSRTR
mmetsp:Transcript_2003/g.4741  ORF Transcript_2003/g.4741 Transcript_2003/m.4741 type:complete len:249 (+) Transcript_2003:155-901(+)